MGEGVPVDSVIGAVLQGEAELEVEVQHILPVAVSQSPTVEVGFNHIVTQLGSLVFNLKWSREEIFCRRLCTRVASLVRMQTVGDDVPQGPGNHL